MKCYFIILLMVVTVFAGNSAPVSNPQVDSDIEITVVNHWTLSDKALDLDIMETPDGPVVLGIDNGDNVIRIWENGLTSTQMNLPPALDGRSWGVACSNQGDTVSQIIVNDFLGYDLYVSDDAGVSWGTVADPTDKLSAGMDHDGSMYWTVINDFTDKLCRFTPGGAFEVWEIPEIGGDQQGSGVATFPLEGGDTGIAVAVFDSPVFFIFSWNGVTLSYLGSVDTPFASSVLVSFGLTYCESTGHFFWTYGPTSGYNMVEFTMSISQQSLSSTSWGAIKSSF